MSENNDKWDLVEGVIAGKENPQNTIAKSLTIDENMSESAEGLIEKFKSNRIKRKAAVNSLKLLYDAHLDIAKQQVTKAVEIKSAEIEKEAERYLQEINRQHLDSLRQIGFANVESRNDGLIQLSRMTSKKLKIVMEEDFPPIIRDQTIEAIMELQKRHLEKLMKE